MSAKSKIINFTIIILSIVVLLAYILFVDGIENIMQVFLTINPLWLLAGAGCMVMYWTIEGSVLNCSVGFFRKKMTMRQSAKTCMIGQFFNCITPSSTGGQAMQAYYMYRIDISVGFATSALLIRFIVYQVTLTIYSSVVLSFKYQEFAAQVAGFQYLILFGYCVNTTIAIMLLLIGFKKNIVYKIMHFIVRALAKLHIVKNLDKQLARVDKEVDMFHAGFSTIKSHKKKLLVLFFMTALQLTFFFLVPAMVACSFGIDMSLSSILTMIAGASCVQMGSSFVPLPGAAGGAELSFYMLFGSYFASNQINSAILLWRILTFYMPILVGMFFSRDVFGKKEISEATETLLKD